MEIAKMEIAEFSISPIWRHMGKLWGKSLLALTLSLLPGPADMTVPLSTLPNPCSGKITPPFVVYKI